VTLIDPRGKPLSGYAKTPKSSMKPIIDQSLGHWAGRDEFMATLPGGGVMQFDLSRLTLADFRAMRQHYQLGASINVLSFMMHQIDWSVESENTEAAEVIEDTLRENWTMLIRGISQSFWAGFSPNAINYKNGENGYVVIDKVKDLIPEECRPNWRKEFGWAPPGKVKPTIYHYDGLWQGGHYIPPDNTLWYPLLMENGNYFGRKLLQPAFPAWFFSNLMHLFANRYFERFGEPLPIGRAPFDEEVDMGGGNFVNGKKAMEQVIASIRNRSAAVLPSDRDPSTKEWDWDIKYLESQMRGADFERYLGRLDEEMSLSVFTPILLFRTADVGSYNLGQAHLKIFQQMLNAIAADIEFYVQHYVVDRLHAINFPGDKSIVKWKYRPQGQYDLTTYKEVMTELIRKDVATPNLEELSAITGIRWAEAQVIAADPEEPGQVDDDGNPLTDFTAARAVAATAAARTAREYGNGANIITLSHRNRFRQALESGGFSTSDAESMTSAVYAKMDSWLADVADVGLSADELKSSLDRLLEQELAR
jgi:hypothetical protein